MKLSYFKILVYSSILAAPVHADLVGYFDYESDFEDQSSANITVNSFGNVALDTTTAAVGSSSIAIDNTTDTSIDSYIRLNLAGNGVQLSEKRFFTISMWARSNSGGVDDRLFSESTDGSIRNLFNIGTGLSDPTRVAFFRRTPQNVTVGHTETPQTVFGTPTSDPQEDWHHICLVSNDGVVDFYVDGVFSFNETYNFETEPVPVTITTLGGIIRDNQFVTGFTGNIDEVAFFDTALTVANVTLLANQTPPTAIDDFVDSDGDGLSDSFEITSGLDPNDDGTTDPNNGASGDPDGDLLFNIDEQTARSNPQVADTDDDGLNDRQEVDFGSSPTNTDSDSDGLDDEEEFSEGTNPNSNDSDNDTLTDFFEVEFGLNPNDDGSVDEENGATGDPDEDGLDNAGEQAFGTDPFEEDADNDDLLDGAERDAGTDPRNDDTDDDNLSDFEEVFAGTDGFITNPLVRDTDGDSINDDTDSDPTDIDVPTPIGDIPTDGLIHYWPLDDGSGLTAADAVGANDGTWQGADNNLIWLDNTAALFDGAAELNGDAGGTNNFNLGTLGFDGGTEFSISLWFNERGNVDSSQQYTGIFMARPQNFGMAIRDNDSNLDFRYAGENGGSQANILPISEGEWHHIAMTYDSATQEVNYALDGIYVTSTLVNRALTVNGAGWAMGNDGESNPAFRDFDGFLDDVAVWDRALTRTELVAIYQAGLSGNPIGSVLIPDNDLAFSFTNIEIQADGSVNLALTATGSGSLNYEVLSTNDLTLPLDDWTSVTTGTLVVGASENVSTPAGFANANERQFFIIREAAATPAS